MELAKSSKRLSCENWFQIKCGVYKFVVVLIMKCQVLFGMEIDHYLRNILYVSTIIKIKMAQLYPTNLSKSILNL